MIDDQKKENGMDLVDRNREVKVNQGGMAGISRGLSYYDLSCTPHQMSLTHTC